jgi:hypothetical protein
MLERILKPKCGDNYSCVGRPYNEFGDIFCVLAYPAIRQLVVRVFFFFFCLGT